MEKQEQKRSEPNNFRQDQNPSTPSESHLNLESSPSDSPPHSPLSSSTSSLSNASPPPSTHWADPKALPAAVSRADPSAPGSHLSLQSPPSDSAPGSPLSYNVSALSHDSPPPPSQQLEPNPPQAIISYSKAVPRAPDRPAPAPPVSHLKLKSLLSDSSSDSPLSHASSPSPPHQQPDPIPPSAAVKTAPTVPNGLADGKVSEKKAGDGSSARFKPGFSILRKSKREGILRKALLAFRISGSIFCLISLSVMAADRDRGWALDSFYRYTELRYCMGVNVIGFVYSGIQAFDLALQMITTKHTVRFRYYLDFVLDQMLTYLLISASSSASVCIDEWQSDWGKDKFPEMATASVGLSFAAFVAFALSSLVSGYFLSTPRAT